jgi:hypothetical protein
LAFSATQAISSSTTAHHAHGVKAHTKSDSADSFADLLAAADAAAQADDDAPLSPDVQAKTPPQAADAKTEQPDGGEEDETPMPAEAPLIQAALPQQPETPQSPAPSAKKDDGKAATAKTEPAANDNTVAAPPQLAILLPQQPPQQQPAPVATAPGNNDGIAPLATGDTSSPSATPPSATAGVPQQQQATAAPSSAPASAPQQTQAAAAQPDDDSEEAEASGVQQAAATPNADNVKPKSAGDFRKALDDAQSASAKPAPAATKDGAAPAQNTPSHAEAGADTHADGHADSGQADVRPADAATQPPASVRADSNPQPGVLPMAAATPAPHGIAAQTAAPMPAQLPVMPMLHHAPNMESLAVDITAKSLGGARQFDIRLDPPELGRVEVRLSIDATGKASAHLSADQPQTLDLLQKDASSLTRALRDAGLNVAQDGLNFSLRSQQQQAGNDRQQQQQSGGRAFRGTVTVPATLQPVAAAASTGRSGRGLLDIKV